MGSAVVKRFLSGWPALRRLVLRCIVVLLALWLAACLTFIVLFDPLFHLALGSLSKSLNGSLEVGAAGLSWRGFKVKNLKLTALQNGQVLSVDRGEFQLHLLRGLFTRQWHEALGDVSLEGVQLNLFVDQQGILNLGTLLAHPQKDTLPFLTRYHGLISVKDGWLSYRDERESGFLYQLKNWNCQLHFHTSGSADVHLQAEPDGQQAAGKVELDGQLGFTHPSVGLRAHLENIELLHVGQHPTVRRSVAVEDGRVSATMWVHGHSDLWDNLVAHLFFNGQVDVDGLAARSLEVPVRLSQAKGRLILVGGAVRSDGLTGKLDGSPVRLSGSLMFEPAPWADLSLQLGRLDLGPLARQLHPPAPIQGMVDLDLRVEGPLRHAHLSGSLSSDRLVARQHEFRQVKASFEADRDAIHVPNLQARVPGAGKLAASGWLFLKPGQPMLVRVKGDRAALSMLSPELAGTASFEMAAVGPMKNPMVYGQGSLAGMQARGVQVDSASGKMLYSDDSLWMWDGQAQAQGAHLQLPWGYYQPRRRFLEASLAAQDVEAPPFRLGGRPLTGRVTGNLSLWGPVDHLDKLQALGSLRESFLDANRQRPIDDLHGSFLLSQGQIWLPRMEGASAGGTVAMTGRLDARLKNWDLYFDARGIDTAALSHNPWFQMPKDLQGRGNAVAAWGSLGPHHSSFRVAIDSASGSLAGAGEKRPGWLGVAAFGHQALAGGVDWSLTADSVPGGKMDLAYLSQLAHYPAGGSPVQLLGQATLVGRHLRLEPNQLSWTNPSLPSTPGFALEGSAYPFFGPVLGQPLQPTVPVGAAWLGQHPEVAGDGHAGLSGDLWLDSGKLNLRYGVYGLDLGWLTPNLRLPGYDLRSALLTSRGRVGGTLKSPRWEAEASIPWLALSRPGGGKAFMSLAGRLHGAGRSLWADPLWISGRPYDSRLASGKRPSMGPSLIRLAGSLDLGGTPRVDLQAWASAFPVHQLAVLLPGPSLLFGNLSTQALRLWGPLTTPSLSGRVTLRQGGVWLQGEPMPIQQAVVDFSSGQGLLRVPNLTLDSGPIHLEGNGTRSSDGSINADLWAADLPLEYLHPLGRPWTGLQGELDLAMSLRSRRGTPPTAYLGFTSERLTWDLGGAGGPFSVEDVTFGRVTNAGGHITTGPGEGVQLRFSAGRLELQLPEGAVSMSLPAASPEPGGKLSASGTVSLGAPHAPLTTWFASPQGPDFKNFQTAFQNLSWAQLSRFLGDPQGSYQAVVSGKLDLEGQWHRDHELGSRASLPSYSLNLDQMRLQGGTAHPSGFNLEQPVTLGYRREGSSGLVHLDPLRLAFLGLPGGKGRPQGELTVQGDLVLTQSSHKTSQAPPPGHLELAARDLPLENLGFLFPGLEDLSGHLDRFDLSLDGPLMSPRLQVSGQVGAGQVGPVHFGKAQLQAHGAPGEGGRYELALDPGLELFFGSDLSEAHQLALKGTVGLDWERLFEPPSDRLHLVWEGWRLKSSSPLNLEGTLLDQNMEIVNALLPGATTSGRMQGSLKLTGTLAEPDLTGSLLVEGGSVTHSALGSPLTDLNMLARFERIAANQAERPGQADFLNRYTLERLEGKLGGQPFTGSGKAELAGLDPQFLDVHFHGDQLPLRFGDLFQATVDTDFNLATRPARLQGQSGMTQVPVLTGKLSVQKGDLTFPLGSLEQARTAASSGHLKVPFRYDLNLSLGDDFWVNFLQSSVRASGDLKVLPSASGNAPVLAGEVFLSRGQIRIPLYELTFRVRRGYAYFDQDLIPVLQGVEADTDLGTYHVTARIDGKYPDVKAELVSQPPLPQAQLQQLVAYGGTPPGYSGPTAGLPTSETSGSGLLANQGLTFVSGLLATPLTQGLTRALFLSEVTFDYLPPADYTVRLAKSLDPMDRLLITFTQIIRPTLYNEYLYGIEYRFVRNLLLRASINNFGQPNLWFQGVLRL